MTCAGHSSTPLRWILAALGVAYLVLLGVLGESLMSVIGRRLHNNSALALPWPTRIVLDAFWSESRFLLSLTPFMLAAVGTAAVASRRDRRSMLLFLPGLLAVLLAATIYALLYAFCLALPLLPLGVRSELDGGGSGWLLPAIALLDLLIVAAFVRSYRRRL